MAYPSGMNTGICPSTHPVKLISIFYEVFYDAARFDKGWLDANGKPYRAMPFFYSTGDNTGFGHHGDFLNGWNTAVLQRAVDECTDMSGNVYYCKPFTFRSDEDARACRPEYQAQFNETTPAGQIPNINKIEKVAAFDPCGYSPFQAYDDTVAGQPLGTCTGTFTNKPAYTPNSGNMTSTAVVKLTGPFAAPNPIDQDNYLGCFTDGISGRAFEKRIGENHTPKSCIAAAKALSQNYVVVAIQYGGECWASIRNDTYAAQGPSTRCKMSCTADEWYICGGPNANQVYKVPGAQLVNPIDQTGYVGCYRDNLNGNRAFEKRIGSGYTPATCRAAVAALGSQYVRFGLQYGGECWATVNSAAAIAQGTSTQCTMACTADPKGILICGGPDANQVYNVKVATI